VKRTAARETGWGHAFLDRWFSRGVTSVMLCVEEAVGDLFIGIVSSNFRANANVPLSESEQAVVVHTSTGNVWRKGVSSILALPLPLKHAMQQQRRRQWQEAAQRQRQWQEAAPRCVVRGGSVLRLTIDMERRELAIEVVSEDDAFDVQSSVVIEGLPVEVGVAVCFGAGEQCVRVLGVSVEEGRSKSTPPVKMLTDLWDDANVIQPLRARRTRRSRELSSHLAHSLELMHVALSCS